MSISSVSGATSASVTQQLQNPAAVSAVQPTGKVHHHGHGGSSAAQPQPAGTTQSTNATTPTDTSTGLNTLA